MLTDRAFAGADTLATSYALAQAIKKIGVPDIVLGGRQAIDGDTAQVGPQVAQKLDLNQVTYVTSVDEVKDGKVVVTRHIDGGIERVEAPMPILLTVNVTDYYKTAYPKIKKVELHAIYAVEELEPDK